MLTHSARSDKKSEVRVWAERLLSVLVWLWWGAEHRRLVIDSSSSRWAYSIRSTSIVLQASMMNWITYCLRRLIIIRSRAMCRDAAEKTDKPLYWINHHYCNYLSSIEKVKHQLWRSPSDRRQPLLLLLLGKSYFFFWRSGQRSIWNKIKKSYREWDRHSLTSSH